MPGDVRDDNSYQNDHSNLNNNLTNQSKEFNIINQNISKEYKDIQWDKIFTWKTPTNNGQKKIMRFKTY